MSLFGYLRIRWGTNLLLKMSGAAIEGKKKP
jgi:hypothetical protein